jgi:hypothetical protein
VENVLLAFRLTAIINETLDRGMWNLVRRVYTFLKIVSKMFIIRQSQTW